MLGDDNAPPPVHCDSIGPGPPSGSCDEVLSRMPTAQELRAFGFAGLPGVDVVLPQYFTSGQ